MSKEQEEKVLIAIAIVSGGIALWFTAVVVWLIFLIPFVRLYKSNRALKIYGIFLMILGSLLFIPEIKELAFEKVLYLNRYLMEWIPGEKVVWFFMDLFRRCLEAQFGFIGPLFSGMGASSLIFSKVRERRDIRGKKIRAKGAKKFRGKRLRADFESYIKGRWGEILYIGRDKWSGEKVYLCTKEREGHTLILGATRSGKTSRVIAPTIESDLKNGFGGVFADPKGDMNLLLYLYKQAKKMGRGDKFKVFSVDNPEISHPYNPLINGNITQILSRIMEAFDWANPYYESVSEMRLGEILEDMKKGGTTPTFRSLFEAFKKEKDDKYSGMLANLSRIVRPEFSRLYEYEEGSIDFLRAHQESEFIYIMANVDSYLRASHMLIRLMVLDLMWAANRVQSDARLKPNFFPIIIDEFGDFFVKGFSNFLKKCGSAGFSLHLACQSFGDLRERDIEDQVISNTSNKIILGQTYPMNVDMTVKIFGTYETAKETVQIEKGTTTGLGTIRSGNEFRVDPELVNNLPKGCAMFKNPKETRYVDLAISKYFRLKKEQPYISEKEKTELYEELKAKALRAQSLCKRVQGYNIFGEIPPGSGNSGKSKKEKNIKENLLFEGEKCPTV